MKDIQKIKEFFSKPLGEVKKDEYGNHLEPQFKKGDKVTYLGHPAEITAVNKEMGGTYSYSVEYDKGQGKTKASNLKNKGGEIKMAEAVTAAYEAKKETAVDMAKKQLDALGVKYEMSGNEFKPFKVIYKPVNKSDKFYDKFEDIIHLFNLGSAVKQSMSEAKEEDAVDTITMDIPLFLRMLEYSREDAEQDLDLHDVTEKANKLGKERGILSMDDYEEIVGAAEEIKEGMSGQLDEPFFIEVSVRDARKALDLFQDRYRNSNIEMYGSNVYAADTPEDIYDLYYDLRSQDIEILDANVEDEDYDYDSEYEKTLAETILRKLKNSFKK